MTLPVRPKVYELPSYSLTGDLIGFLRCGLQYRYTRIGGLPASRPVQLWFGEFIHGVLEESYRRYRESVVAGSPKPPPWAADVIADISSLFKVRLAARGLFPWDKDLEELGDRRAHAAIQELGPALFPLISRAEVRLYGARMLPPIEEQLRFREADRYEMVGIVDVVTHVELNDPNLRSNVLVHLLAMQLQQRPTSKFEVIVDYKGMRRPPALGMVKGSLWEQYAWQIQTYAELRRKQAGALPVAAGALMYVNELMPTRSDLEALKSEIKAGLTDVPPEKGSETEQMVKSWVPGRPLPMLPLEYRLKRALRVIPVTPKSIAEAVHQFDKIVKAIETCRGREIGGESVTKAWDRNCNDESTCTVCDSRTFCPDYQKKFAGKHNERAPRLTAVRRGS
jgi:hypothetical protein